MLDTLQRKTCFWHECEQTNDGFWARTGYFVYAGINNFLDNNAVSMHALNQLCLAIRSDNYNMSLGHVCDSISPQIEIFSVPNAIVILGKRSLSDLMQLLNFCDRLFALAAQRGLIVRAGVSFGKYEFNTLKREFRGPACDDAFYLHNKAEWAGFLFDDSVWDNLLMFKRFFEDLDEYLESTLNLIKYPMIPYMENVDKPTNRLALMPLSANLLKIIECFEGLKANSQASMHRFFDNTIAFLTFCRLVSKQG